MICGYMARIGFSPGSPTILTRPLVSVQHESTVGPTAMGLKYSGNKGLRGFLEANRCLHHDIRCCLRDITAFNVELSVFTQCVLGLTPCLPSCRSEYAQVIKMLGNGRLEAMCFDGTKRLCHIRGKLRKKVGLSQLSPSPFYHGYQHIQETP